MPATVTTQAPRKLLSYTLLAILFGHLAGCISYSSDQTQEALDVPHPTLLAQIQLGETPSQWLRDHLGEPSSVRLPSETQSVWQYENTQHTRTRVRALPLLAIETNRRQRTIFNFAIERNRIVRYWQDNQPAD